ncbi:MULTISPECIES: hypothetical protein [Sphingobacterium]|uniref:hypothetical protein n=1 Tax=Sphingobacterium TaxID=28453 RepID=UPI0015FA86AF|nr:MULTISPECIES: hypothetical protein [Sphingobacterium]MBA8986796.1 hypothetical protein [Sphingobacterium soli]WFB64991.1 hypothetical protein PZ892_07195 [Sphingobacterium sp. WM]
MQNTDKIKRLFNQKHLNDIRNNQAKVKNAFQKAINKIFAGLPNVKAKDRFDIGRIPQLNRFGDNVLAEW